MIKFKDYFNGLYCQPLEYPSVKVQSRHKNTTLFLKFNSQDVLTEASYQGEINPWLGSLCGIIRNKTLNELISLTCHEWKETFKEDQYFWDLYQGLEDQIFFTPLELLHAALDIYRGRDYQYEDAGMLVCRCFGVREKDVLAYLQSTTDPSISSLSETTKAAMGCRSCLPQLKRWLQLKNLSSAQHYFKEKPRAQWLLEIDYFLSCYPLASDWKMEVKSFQGDQVVISFNKEISQKELEKTGEELQDFLSRGLDPDLNFFLARS